MLSDLFRNWNGIMFYIIVGCVIVLAGIGVATYTPVPEGHVGVAQYENGARRILTPGINFSVIPVTIYQDAAKIPFYSVARTASNEIIMVNGDVPYTVIDASWLPYYGQSDSAISILLWKAMSESLRTYALTLKSTDQFNHTLLAEGMRTRSFQGLVIDPWQLNIRIHKVTGVPNVHHKSGHRN